MATLFRQATPESGEALIAERLPAEKSAVDDSVAQAAPPRTLPRLTIVVPCFDEEEVLPETARRLGTLLQRLRRVGRVAAASRILFVDDGSRDRTWEIIEQLAREDERMGGIKLSRNRGHQNALLAGLFTAEGDVVVSVDADLQDDVDIIEEMLSQHARGMHIVYGVRNDRSSDGVFKRATALGFYRMIHALGVESVYNHADFRLLSRRAVDALKDFREVNLFLRGIVPLIGFKSSVVYYTRTERMAGVSKYPLRKMLALAMDAVTSFSVVPLRLISALGVLVFLFSVGMGVWTLWIKLFSDRAVPGWTSTLLPIYLLGGLQILCVGILGEYLGKVYQETKRRPRYIIEKVL
ncbi:MAG TPA: glycosyltransferase family 2 protein [Steroidobacteraceae bacterium]|nr:glycosyltransferase family 2 protein [Steroidobacteraceae bacterium]